MSGIELENAANRAGSSGPIRWVLKQPYGSQKIPPNRVCDRCIRKKTRCDLRHPSCSSCVDAGWNCTYSHTRKRPGPSKGSHRRARVALSQEQSYNQGHSNSHQTLYETGDSFQLPAVGESITPSFPEIHPILEGPSFSITRSLETYYSQLLLEQIYELAENFSRSVNTVFPLFQQGQLVDQLKNGTICHSLPSIICAVSAKARETYFWRRDMDVDAELSCLAESATIESENATEPLALNQWRTACLLAWYGFHQTPGNGEAIRIALLTRKAYQCGLHQIDSAEDKASFGWDSMGEETLEDWRHVWWCISILDCHASFLTATPHQVEPESTRTALPQNTTPSDSSQNPTARKFYLPSDRAGLWKVVQEISSTEGDKTFGLHMAISTLLKEVVTLRRLHIQSPSQSVQERTSALEDHLSAVQLALPRNYMWQRRNIIQGESDASYHCRLLTLLKIYSIRLVLLPLRSLDSSQWNERWQENLDICQHVVAVIQQWDIQSMPAIDPAVCFITLAVLVMLHLHSLSSGVARPQLREQLARRKDIIRLFLRNYATCWALPRFLLDCYDALERKIVNPLCSEDIARITEQFNGPLHQRWLNFLSVPSPDKARLSDRFRTVPLNVTGSLSVGNMVEGMASSDYFGFWDDMNYSIAA